VLAEAVTVLLLWTNPSTNQDGTPCTDLASIRIRAKRESTGQNFNLWHPLCNEDGCVSGPGLPDSMRATFPQREGIDWYSFDAWAYDSTGNESYPSDAIRLDLGSGAPITGVEPTPSVPSVEQWFNVRGQRIERPVASGIYWRRLNGVTERVVLVK